MVDVSSYRLAPGWLTATPGALAALRESGESPTTYLDRHMKCDFGDLDDDDRRANQQALADGSRILSAYRLRRGKKIWIITEAVGDDGRRASTCILLPDEY